MLLDMRVRGVILEHKIVEQIKRPFFLFKCLLSRVSCVSSSNQDSRVLGDTQTMLTTKHFFLYSISV